MVHVKSKNRSPEILGSILKAPWPTNHKKGQISKSLLIGTQIDNVESENHGPDSLGYILRALGIQAKTSLEFLGHGSLKIRKLPRFFESWWIFYFSTMMAILSCWTPLDWMKVNCLLLGNCRKYFRYSLSTDIPNRIATFFGRRIWSKWTFFSNIFMMSKLKDIVLKSRSFFLSMKLWSNKNSIKIKILYIRLKNGPKNGKLKTLIL